MSAGWPEGEPSGVAFLVRPGREPLRVTFLPPRVGRAVLFLLVLVGAYLLAADDRLLSLQEINVLGPVALLWICLFAAADLIRRNALLAVSPLFWLFVISAVYYGLGPLVLRYGNPISVLYVNEFYSVDEATLLRTHLLNASSLLIVGWTFSLGLRFFPLKKPSAPLFDDRQTDRFILFCLLVGAPVRYLLVPLNNSMTLGFFLPSQLLNFQFLVVFALMLMIRGRLSGSRTWSKILYPLLGWELLVRFSGGGKLDIFLLLLPIFLGIYLARPNLTLFVKAAVVAVLAWVVVTRTTDAVRLADRSGRTELGDRVSAVLTAFNDDSPRYGSTEDGDVQRAWTRLCYSTAQAYCLDSYDEGRPGDTFSMWYWIFVPRMLFPEKPEMTPGQMFNVTVTDNPDSKSAPGAFAEAYWNGGWPMVFVTCVFLGALFVFLTHVAVRTFLAADYRWLPLAWLGIVMGLRIDDFFVPTYLGGWTVGLVNCGVFYLFFPSRRPEL